MGKVIRLARLLYTILLYCYIIFCKLFYNVYDILGVAYIDTTLLVQCLDIGTPRHIIHAAIIYRTAVQSTSLI